MNSPKFRAAALLQPLVRPGIIIEAVTWALPDGIEQVRAIKKHCPEAPHGGCCFIPAESVVDTFDVLGEELALEHYRAHLARHNVK